VPGRAVTGEEAKARITPLVRRGPGRGYGGEQKNCRKAV